MTKDVKKHFIRIFALSLAVTLLLSPARPFSRSEGDPFITEVRAEEEPITDTQRGIALLMTILFAQGLRFVGDWNTVVQPGLEQLWEDFSSATGNAVTLPMIVAGSSLALGYIRTSNTVNNAIANFTAWYKATFEQPVTGDVTIPVGSGGASYVPMDGCTKLYNILYGTGDYYWNTDSAVRYTQFYHPAISAFVSIAVSTSSFRYSVANGNISSCPGVSQYANSITYNGVIYYYLAQNWNTQRQGELYFYQKINPWVNVEDSYVKTGIYYTYGDGATLGDVSMEGQSLELKDGYQLESDQAKLYDIAGLEALVASLALTLENIDDLVRDIPLIFDTPWAEDFPDVPAYVDTPDDTIPWVDVPDSVIPADTPEYVPTVPSERDEYKVLGLDQVFPFSIPFDLYYLTQILVHEPETPSFTFAMVNPVNGQLITEELDLSDFDGIASIARTIETILFIAFLIFVTRGLIRS